MKEFKELGPDPAALVESLRAFSYSAESAIADLIDNSITAGCRNVFVYSRWNDGRPAVEIVDDGVGMDKATLEGALRFAGMGPSAPRGPADLGRFGLGLKTASLSQCRRFTVTTVRDGTALNLGWDVDELNDNGGRWIPSRDSDASVRAHRKLIKGTSGTLVRWEKLDRLLGVDEDLRSVDDFDATFERVEQHLGMVFHRFMSGLGPDGGPRLRIHVNDRELVPWDPFLERYPVQGQVMMVEQQHLDLPSGVARVVGYVLPTEREARADGALEAWEATGRGRWNQLQGFYVYRLDRLLTFGGYLGLSPQPDEHTKLARIAIDLDNTTDTDWLLDVTKSSVTPPPRSRSQLEQIARRVRGPAATRYRHRVRTWCRTCSQRPCVCPRARELELVWEAPDLLEGRGKFKINANHSLIKAFSGGLETGQKAQFSRILRMIVSTLPLGLLRGVPRDDEKRYGVGDEEEAMLRDLLDFITKARTSKGDSLSSIEEDLRFTEPFSEYPDLIDAFFHPKECVKHGE